MQKCLKNVDAYDIIANVIDFPGKDKESHSEFAAGIVELGMPHKNFWRFLYDEQI